jgi:hypothetical protein
VVLVLFSFLKKGVAVLYKLKSPGQKVVAFTLNGIKVDLDIECLKELIEPAKAEEVDGKKGRPFFGCDCDRVLRIESFYGSDSFWVRSCDFEPVDAKGKLEEIIDTINSRNLDSIDEMLERFEDEGIEDIFENLSEHFSKLREALAIFDQACAELVSEIEDELEENAICSACHE